MTSVLDLNTSPSDQAHAATRAEQRGRFMICNWVRPVMLHYRLDPSDLQPLVPFPLDLYNQHAYLSLVALSITNLRLGVGGRWIRILPRPALAPCSHPMLNLRTYVRFRNQTGIHFLARWISTRIARFFGLRSFGLPCQPAHLDYRHTPAQGAFQGHVRDISSGGELKYHLRTADDGGPSPATADSLDQFLLERYAAFTYRQGVIRQFRVRHEPWRITPLEGDIPDTSILNENSPLRHRTAFSHAVCCHDLTKVSISRPRWLTTNLDPPRNCGAISNHPLQS